MTVVDNIRFLMEFQSHTMATEVAHNAVMVFVGMLLYGMANITDKAEGLGSLGANLETLLGNPYELFLLWCCLANDEHA